MNNNTEMLFGGARLSPYDERDHRVKSSEDGSFPHSKELVLWKPKTERDQGRTANCVAQAIAVWYATYYFYKAFAMERLKREGLTQEEFEKEYIERLASVGAVYGNRRLTPKDNLPGMIVREGMRLIQKYGDCPSSVWDSNAETPDIINMFEYHFNEFENSLVPIKEYVSVAGKDEAMYLMDKYKLPLLGVMPAKYFNTFSDGYHAVAVYGYRDAGDGYFLINNSWGDSSDHIEVRRKDFIELWGMIPKNYIEFSDVPDEHWANEAISLCANEGLLKGYPDGSFAPDQPITRAEMAVILQRMRQL